MDRVTQIHAHAVPIAIGIADFQNHFLAVPIAIGTQSASSRLSRDRAKPREELETDATNLRFKI